MLNKPVQWGVRFVGLSTSSHKLTQWNRLSAVFNFEVHYFLNELFFRINKDPVRYCATDVGASRDRLYLWHGWVEVYRYDRDVPKGSLFYS